MAIHYVATIGAAMLLALLYAALSPKDHGGLLKKLASIGKWRPSTRSALAHPAPKRDRRPVVQIDPELKSTYPPSRRDILKDIYNDLPASLRNKSPEELVELPLWKQQIDVPLEVPFDELCGEFFTPTGFRIFEIRQIEGILDYAKLSSVPDPKPCKDFDISTALPRPYRPFGLPYHEPESLSKLEPDRWLELNSSYAESLRLRKAIFETKSEQVFQCLPGSELACKELMEMALQFLTLRYPQYFSLDKEVMMFYNKILNTDADLIATPPLNIIMDHIPEDFGIMLRDPGDGTYKLCAAIVFSDQGWTVDDKIGKRLHEIHDSVTGSEEETQLSWYRYLASENMAAQRGSWAFEVDEPRSSLLHDARESQSGRKMQDATTISNCHLRVNWQTIRRLPLSGAIVFNFKSFSTPLEELRNEAYIPALALMELGDSTAERKARHVKHVVAPALAEWAGEQESKGWVPKGWKASKLDEAPFYPGWQDR